MMVKQAVRGRVTQRQAKAAVSAAENGKPLTQPKRKSSSDITVAPKFEGEEEGEKKQEEEKESDVEGKGEAVPKEAGVKKRPKLSWLSSGKQPTIFSKFMSMGWISCHTGGKTETAEPDQEDTQSSQPQENGGEHRKNPVTEEAEEKAKSKSEVICLGVDQMERLFQGLLVLRTRCLECECHAERRPPGHQCPSSPQCLPSHPNPLSSALLSTPPVPPDPKLELRTLKWAISQFASVERIVGEYLCETCHHYTEAERSLPFFEPPRACVNGLSLSFCVVQDGPVRRPLKGEYPPLQTPFKRSLEEWCMHPSATGGQHYQLFAVVIHSAVTISSGRYTTYIISSRKPKSACPRGMRSRAESKRSAVGNCIVRNPRKRCRIMMTGKCLTVSVLGAKKASEGVGLLGGSEEPVQLRPWGAPGHSSNGGIKEEAEEVLVTGCEGAGGGVSTEQALSSLLQYEGKWMLFDDSEVLFFEDDDFLRACSTSTPYLLFYRRVSRQ
uniref:Ubiquitin specific peptidase 1 n=1 Tax=Salmo trutta TaxID=8032 RepID=A0A673XPK3_SALTR